MEDQNAKRAHDGKSLGGCAVPCNAGASSLSTEGGTKLCAALSDLGLWYIEGVAWALARPPTRQASCRRIPAESNFRYKAQIPALETLTESGQSVGLSTFPTSTRHLLTTLLSLLYGLECACMKS